MRNVSRFPRHGAVGVASLLALSACTVGPDYHRPALPAPSGYEGARAAMPPGGPTLTIDQAVAADWWRVFGSDELDALVEQALKANPTLAAAKASLRAAHEAVLVQRGAFYPSLEISTNPSRQKFAETLASPTASGASLYSLTTSQVSISYQPDLFGGNRRAVESLVAQEDAQRFELEAARLTIATSVVASAVQDALLRAEIETTRRIIADQARTLASFQHQRELGQASDADLAAQQALLAQAQSALPPLERQFQANRDALAALVGRTPAEAPVAGFDLDKLALPASLPLSVPARLVEQRPDVRIAEAQLHGASAQVGVAEAARWPNLSIDAGAGTATLGLGASLADKATFWSLAGTLTQPLFQGGALMHRQRGAEAAYDQAAAQYQATVIGAFQNTADVLAALRADVAADNAAQAAQDAAADSLKIARRQLELGDVSPLAALAAEQAYDQARIAALQARAARYADVAALFQALGGGWDAKR